MSKLPDVRKATRLYRYGSIAARFIAAAFWSDRLPTTTLERIVMDRVASNAEIAMLYAHRGEAR